jgi:hypothetical protein|tara:strand:- start:1146 stop:1580 length:435 start_codon:yes stop_codon:yes gene_type:complete
MWRACPFRDAARKTRWRECLAMVYLPGMFGAVRHFLLCLFCLVALVLGSVTSAALMAPGQSDRAAARIAALGFTEHDLCGHMDHMQHDHRCPYCHLLPEVSVPSPASVVRRFLPFSGWQQADDLHRRAQARDHARSPRAPPTIA